MIEFRAVHDGECMDDSPVMTNVLRVCRKCGAEIFADAPEGLCTACLFETGLYLLASDHQEVDCEGGSASPNTISAFGERGPLGKTERVASSQIADFCGYKLIEESRRGGAV